MGKSKHCGPVLRNTFKDLHKDGNSYRKNSRLLGISKTMVENAVKCISASFKYFVKVYNLTSLLAPILYMRDSNIVFPSEGIWYKIGIGIHNNSRDFGIEKH